MNSHRTHKKNLIVSYKNLSDELKEIFKEQYPEGYSDYLQRFEKPNGDTIFVVPMETPDTMYMVKFDVVIDSAYEEDDNSKDYFDEEAEKAGIEFAPLQEALDKEEETGRPRTSSDLQHGSLEESQLNDKAKLAGHKLEITAEELQEAFPDEPEDEEEYDSYSDDEERDDDDEYEPTDEELMDIDSAIFKDAEIPPEELGRMVDEDLTRTVSEAAREAQKAAQPAAKASAKTTAKTTAKPSKSAASPAAKKPAKK